MASEFGNLSVPIVCLDSDRTPHAACSMTSHPKHKRAPRLPVIPDLRFEQSYLRSVSRYVLFQRSSVVTLDNSWVQADSDVPGKGKEKESVVLTQLSAEVLEVQWRDVVWVTIRDQVLSPLFQGALW